jgi:Carboxypeptidase regulatory-like domain/TonB dependent receptor
MHRTIRWSLLLSLSCVVGTFVGQISAQSPAAEIRGQVTDERGGAIIGAKIALLTLDGTEKAGLTDQQGRYAFKSLEAGTYTLRVSAKGFAVYESADLQVSAGQRRVQDIQLRIGPVIETVTVPSESPVGTEPENNADSLVLRGKQLDLLPDDSDDLASALQALAGPAAGPNGGEVFVDGFSGARLPPKSSIREVRVNQNPFAAEFDRIGFGRIEILTKPGTNEFAGEALFNFNDESLNARNPYTLIRAPYQVRSLDLSISGPIVKHRASFFFDLEYRGLDDNAYINALVLDPSLNVVPFVQSALIPRRSQERQPRVDWQINKNHTLVAVVEFNPSHTRHTGIGGFTLPSRAYEVTGYERQFRLTETAVLNKTTVTETRLQVRTDRGEQRPENSSFALNVQDAFNGGGDQSGPSLNRRALTAIYNNTTMTQGPHVLRFGARLRHIKVNDESRANFGGTFTFAGGNAVVLDINNQVVRNAQGEPLFNKVSSLERYRRTLLFNGPGGPPKPPGITDEQLGVNPTQLSIAGGNPEVSITQTDIAGFVQDQWQVRSNLTLNLGLRYEGQTNVHNNLNFAPRIALAWSPKGKNGVPKAVIRGGFGIFFERINDNLTLQSERFNGINQQQYVVTNSPILATFPFIPSIEALNVFALPQTLRRKETDLRSPYLMQSAISYDRQLPFKSTISLSFINTRALHQLRTRNINAPLPGTFVEGVRNSGVRPFVNAGNILEYESSGFFNQKQLIVTLDSRFNSRIFLHATYGLSQARGDTDGVGSFPANTYDLSNEYGRAAIDARHRLIVEGTVSAPWGFRVAPFMIISSGRPFNIIIGRDLNGDTLFTERPAFASSLTTVENLKITQWGRFDLNPPAGATIIPRNYGEGLSFAAVNLRISKTISLNKIRQFFGGPKPNAKDESPYKLSFSVQAQNLLNRTNNDLPVGNLSSPFFGQSTATLGGYGEGNRSSAGNRRITGQIKIEF